MNQKQKINKKDEARYRSAIKDFDEAISMHPNHSMAFVGRADSNLKLGFHDRSLNDCKTALRLSPSTELTKEIYRVKALALYELGRLEESIVALDNIIDLIET